ncbi:maltose/moltooligosaccharide transporter [Mariniphaga anaerophila]|uniref:Maltose/moltooligosaccharide transporter n=1 Tax=Mariniphaga anaerophila TaxID=1484053 RepID=A0A1M5BQU9_9BACT|nr:MFS transporter [Mariniphaga anaerophila]SHF44750.1 maltose/moltooligosaccharide transporter [Mariniphaga anaerophila]
MVKKPTLSFWQIWNMSFGFLGIQFGFALQNANVSRIFETLGAQVENIPILWIAAPVTGLVIQPIIGHMSDKTWNRFGRRRPYFLFGAILASLALILMPNSPALWVAAGMLWIMDASINVSMEPFRAFVGDMLPNEQRTRGFAMQSFFIGTGAVVGSLLPYAMTNWLNIPNTAPEGVIPPSVKWSFYIGGIVFLLAVLWTVFSTKEYPPEKMEEYEKAEKGNSSAGTEYHEIPVPKQKFSTLGIIFGVMGLLIAGATKGFHLKDELYILGGLLIAFFVLMLIVYLLKAKNREENALVEIFSDLIRMPSTMKQLSVVQFFSWMGLFALWIYTTAGVTSHIYHTTDPTSLEYNTGADWVNFLFAVYNGVAALVAFLLPVLAKYTSRKITHAICLTFGAAGMASVYLIGNPTLLILPMIGIGIAWASILSMPYAILTGSLPSHKMGIYMGIFNFFIVIPQILAATILGFLVQDVFGGESILALVFGGASLLLAAISVLFVKDVAAGEK